MSNVSEMDGAYGKACAAYRAAKPANCPAAVFLNDHVLPMYSDVRFQFARESPMR